MSFVGDILKAEREKQKLSIKDIESGTNIRSLYITAIEENKFDVLPGEVYLKGFLRSYANFLNIDSDYLLQVYKEQKGELDSEDEVTEEKESIKPKKKVRKGRVTILLAIVLLFLTAIIYYVMNNDSNSASNAKINNEPVAKVSSKAIVKNEGTKPVNEVNKKLSLKAEFVGDCWIQVLGDNKVVFEGMAKNKDKFEWLAENEFSLKIGNAGAVKLNLNDKDLGSLGKNGEVIDKTFTKDKIN